jgi:hypothetical protein
MVALKIICAIIFVWYEGTCICALKGKDPLGIFLPKNWDKKRMPVSAFILLQGLLLFFIIVIIFL